MIVWNTLKVTTRNDLNGLEISPSSIATTVTDGALNITGNLYINASNDKTTMLGNIDYASFKAPTARFYNVVATENLKAAKKLTIGDSNTFPVTCTSVNAYDWNESSVLNYRNWFIGSRARCHTVVVPHQFDTVLDIGHTHGWNNYSTGFFRCETIDTQNHEEKYSVGFKLSHSVNNESTLELKDWNYINDINLSVKTVKATSVEATNITASDTITANTFNTTSDKRLKTNITPWYNSTSITELPIYSFDYINDNSHHIGCLAQDLQKICPELVHTNNDGYLQIEENKLIYLLLQEVKELKQRVQQLEAK